MSRLTAVFESHESEEKAVDAFYKLGARTETPARIGCSVLCLDSSADVLAYLRELLRGAGYDVQSSSRVGDALLLMRVTHFDLLLVGPDMAASPARPQAFQDACAKLATIELGGEFSTSHAGEAGTSLLEAIAVRLKSA